MTDRSIAAVAAADSIALPYLGPNSKTPLSKMGLEGTCLSSFRNMRVIRGSPTLSHNIISEIGLVCKRLILKDMSPYLPHEAEGRAELPAIIRSHNAASRLCLFPKASCQHGIKLVLNIYLQRKLRYGHISRQP